MGKWGCHGNVSNPFGALAGVTSVGGNRRASTSKSWLSSSQPTSPTSTALTSNLINVPSSRRQWDRSDKSKSKVKLQVTHTPLVINKATYQTCSLSFSELLFGSKWWTQNFLRYCAAGQMLPVMKWCVWFAARLLQTDSSSGCLYCWARWTLVIETSTCWSSFKAVSVVRSFSAKACFSLGDGWKTLVVQNLFLPFCDSSRF